jgi:hypothetical protein
MSLPSSYAIISVAQRKTFVNTCFGKFLGRILESIPLPPSLGKGRGSLVRGVRLIDALSG